MYNLLGTLGEVSEFIDPYWLLGFVEGECFFVGVTNNRLTWPTAMC